MGHHAEKDAENFTMQKPNRTLLTFPCIRKNVFLNVDNYGDRLLNIIFPIFGHFIMVRFALPNPDLSPQDIEAVSGI